MKVAVIGAGIFGLVIASEFASRGAEVTILEQRASILEGTTSGSVLRVHQGPHYPRHDKTARQSRENYREFVDRFSQCIDFNYENFYSISRYNSKTSTVEFEDFIRRNQFEAERVEDSYLKQKFGVNTNQLSGTWFCREGVLGIDALRSHFLRINNESGVELFLNFEVTSAKRDREKWCLSNSESRIENFDFVIQATYGMDYIEFDLPIRRRELLFQRTLVLETKIPANMNLGLTVMDGDFLTLLPKAFSTNHFLYSPKASVLSFVSATKFPKEWKKEVSMETIKLAQNGIVEKCKLYFPALDEMSVLKYIDSFRSLEVSSTKNDARTSEWRQIAPKFIQVLSGKIDHSLGLARAILKEL